MFKKIFRKLNLVNAISLVEVLVAIVLTSIILLSMTRLVIVVLRNTTENERYDQAILQFGKSEETFKSWLLASSGNFLKSVCSLKEGQFLNITKQFSDPNASAYVINPASVDPTKVKTVDFNSHPKLLIRDDTLPVNMWIGLEIIKNTGGEMQGVSYVYWETSGKKNNFTNTIYLFTTDKCLLT